MILKKTVSDVGEIDVTIDEKALDFELSRELTGTTHESEFGIFSGESTEVLFKFGDFSTRILFSGTYSEQWSLEDLCNVFVYRIQKVRDWVRDCKESGGNVDLSKEVG